MARLAALSIALSIALSVIESAAVGTPTVPKEACEAMAAEDGSLGLLQHAGAARRAQGMGELDQDGVANPKAVGAGPEPLSAAPLADAQDWPSKNGDSWRTGHSRSSAPLNLTSPAWTFDGYHGNSSTVSYSSPIVDADGNVYISTCGKGNKGIGVYSLGPDGAVRWQFGAAGMKSFATPWLEDGTLYTASAAGVAYAMDAATGAVKWETKYAPCSALDAWTVVVAKQKMVILAGCGAGEKDNTAMFALDAATGAEKWSFDIGSHVYNVLPMVAGDTVVFPNFVGGLYRLKISSGEVVWRTSDNGDMMTTGGAVMGPNGVLYATSNANATDGWPRASLAPMNPSSAAYGKPFGGKGLLRAHSLKTGAVLWERQFDMEANNAPALLELADKVAVIVGLGNNAMMPAPFPKSGDDWPGAVRAFDAASGADIWSFDVMWKEQAAAGSTLKNLCLPDAWSNAVTSSQGVVYIGWQGGLVFAINGTTGAEVSRYDLHSGIQGEPAIANGSLYVVSCDRTVAFKP